MAKQIGTITKRKTKNLDVMLDLETFGQAPGCAIVAIGACLFGPNGVESTFSANVDTTSCCAFGLTMDPSTVMWWLRQSDAARGALTGVPGQLLGKALSDLTAWLNVAAPFESRRIWGNGAGFDQPILAAAYRATGLSLPWRFYNERCFRTVRAAYPGVVYAKPTDAHNALSDAVAQAAHMVKLVAAGLVLA